MLEDFTWKTYRGNYCIVDNKGNILIRDLTENQILQFLQYKERGTEERLKKIEKDIEHLKKSKEGIRFNKDPTLIGGKNE